MFPGVKQPEQSVSPFWYFICTILMKRNEPFSGLAYRTLKGEFQQGMRDNFLKALENPKNLENARVLAKWAAYLAEMKGEIAEGIDPKSKWDNLHAMIERRLIVLLSNSNTAQKHRRHRHNKKHKKIFQ